jgi:hypothetical protein
MACAGSRYQGNLLLGRELQQDQPTLRSLAMESPLERDNNARRQELLNFRVTTRRLGTCVRVDRQRVDSDRTLQRAKSSRLERWLQVYRYSTGTCGGGGSQGLRQK